MNYRHHTIRCRHGFCRELVRCEACEGKWTGGPNGTKPEPGRNGTRVPVVNKRHGRPKRDLVPVSYRGRI